MNNTLTRKRKDFLINCDNYHLYHLLLAFTIANNVTNCHCVPNLMHLYVCVTYVVILSEYKLGKHCEEKKSDKLRKFYKTTSLDFIQISVP